MKGEGAAPTLGGGYTHTRGERVVEEEEEEEEEEAEQKGTPVIVTKDSKTKMIMAKAAPTKGVENYVMELAKKIIEQLGYRRAMLRSDNDRRFWHNMRQSGERAMRR